MTTSSANVTPLNMELTPCRVTFNNVDLGGTLKNVKVSASHKKADIKADQFGETVIDRRVSAQEYKIETILAEVKDKDHWKVVFPTTKQVGTGNKAMYFDAQIGASDLAVAHSLLLHPLSQPDNVLDYDHLFYKATAESISEITFGPTEQQGLKVVWHVFPDTSINPARFWFHGDPANGLVAAVAGAASPGENTGDGTISAITANSGVSPTETITLTCLDAVTGNNFKIEGSVSGILGVAHVGATSGDMVSFTPGSPTPAVISLTINQGATQFAVGDTFTIAVTGANYA